MSYLAGIHDLAYCFQRLGGAGSSAYSGDWLGMGANLGATAGKAMWYGRNQISVLKDALAKSGTKVLPTPTAIVDVCMVAISAVDLLNGFGPPDKGAAFNSGVDKLQNVYLQLDAAVPDSRDWSGKAAQAYTQQNAAMLTLVQTMQELDKQMQALVADQGAEIQKAHNAIALTLFGLVVAQGVALALYLIPVVGPEISCAWQIVAAFAAGATVFAFEMLTLSNSMSLSHSATALAGKYGEVAADAVPNARFAKIEVAAAPETTVGSFKAISDSMSTFSAPPTVATLAGVAGESASPQQRALLSSLGDGETPAARAPEAPTPAAAATAAELAAPAVPAFALPTPAQVTQASSQAASMSGSASQRMNLVNLTMGSVQQLASMGQQGQTTAAPAEVDASASDAAPHGATLTGDAEGAGAAQGTQGAERAAVEGVRVGGDELQAGTDRHRRDL